VLHQQDGPHRRRFLLLSSTRSKIASVAPPRSCNSRSAASPTTKAWSTFSR
jgi:hypothetical protein